MRKFLEARRASVPLLTIATPDPAATIDRLRAAEPKTTPLLAWDAVNGLVGLNELGRQNLALAIKDQKATVPLVGALVAMGIAAPHGALVFVHNPQRLLEAGNPNQVIQALWNLRDQFKTNARMVVLLGPYLKIPPELANDLVSIDEALPSRQELDEILLKQYANTKDKDDQPIPPPPPAERAAVLDAVVGLSAFAAEQVIAMAFRNGACDPERCWDRKIKMIEATGTLSVWKGTESFDDLKGIDNAQEFCRDLMAADAFKAVVFMDEIEKALAGGLSSWSGDNGVSKDQIAVLLQYIADTKSLGLMFVGLAGTGKTDLAKAMARASGKPLIKLDLGAMKGGTVGASEGRIRSALKVITAIAEGKVLFVATANNTSTFTPELHRRFADQFFFDQPPLDVVAQIFDVYIRKNALTSDQLADFQVAEFAGWTGDEIRRVCERAAMFKKTIMAAKLAIVPNCISSKENIDDQRRNAMGRIVSASYPGVYHGPKFEPEDARHRAIHVD